MADHEHPNPEQVKQRIGRLQDAIADALAATPPKLAEAFAAFAQYRDAVIDVFDSLPEHHVDRYAKTAHQLATEIEAHRDLVASPAAAAAQLYEWAGKAYRKLADLVPEGSVTKMIYLRQAGIERDRALLASRGANASVHQTI
jgi:hypothetical protein